jgi:hypothetical protein
LVQCKLPLKITGLAIVLSAAWHHSAFAGSACWDKNAAVAIADLSEQAVQFMLEGEGAKAVPYQREAIRLTKAYCVLIDTYPPQKTNNSTKFGCRVFSGETRLSSGELKTVYWTKCPESKE